jgi:hypothetical protein
MYHIWYSMVIVDFYVMDMYHIWYNMFIDNLSVAPIGVYHMCYTPAVERQNHSLKKYVEISYMIQNAVKG